MAGPTILMEKNNILGPRAKRTRLRFVGLKDSVKRQATETDSAKTQHGSTVNRISLKWLHNTIAILDQRIITNSLLLITAHNTSSKTRRGLSSDLSIFLKINHSLSDGVLANARMKISSIAASGAN